MATPISVRPVSGIRSTGLDFSAQAPDQQSKAEFEVVGVAGNNHSPEAPRDKVEISAAARARVQRQSAPRQSAATEKAQQAQKTEQTQESSSSTLAEPKDLAKPYRSGSDVPPAARAQLLKQQGHTVSEIAVLLGLARETVTKYLTDHVSPADLAAAAIASVAPVATTISDK